MTKTTVRTNTLQNSKKEVIIKKVTFKELWKNYPQEGYKHNADNINDYCAIRVSMALMKSGIKLKSFEGASCWGCPTKEKHAIRAEELANWLNNKPFAGCPKVEKLKGEEFRSKMNGRTGIVFFKDYWQRSGETGETRTGDHIDLWDGRGLDKLASQGGIANFITNTLGLYGFSYSDKTKAAAVWFWEIE